MSSTYELDVLPGRGGLFVVHGEGDHDGRGALFVDPDDDVALIRVVSFRGQAMWNRAYLVPCPGLSAGDVERNREMVAQLLENMAASVRDGSAFDDGPVG